MAAIRQAGGGIDDDIRGHHELFLMVLDTAWHVGQAGIGTAVFVLFCETVSGAGSGERLFVLRVGVPRYVPFSSAQIGRRECARPRANMCGKIAL